MKALFLILGFFSLMQLQGQKLVKKALVSPLTEHIQIDTQFCHELHLGTSKTNEISVQANMEGEYAKDLLVSIQEDGANIRIGAQFQPNFTNPNDKLSAHKVISIVLHVILPENKAVFVYGTTCNTTIKGDYKNLEVKLSDGRCLLDNVKERVTVTTQKGDITLKTASGKVDAKSTYGQVFDETIPDGDNQFTLNTIEGKIHLKKTK